MEEEERTREEGLLEGVFNIDDVILRIVGAWDRPDTSKLMNIWSITHASASFVADNFARRLENYFWRLWSCESLMQTLSGAQIQAHVKAISEGVNIRTTPRGSPRVSRDLQVYFTAPQPTHPSPSAPPSKSSSAPAFTGTAILSPSTPWEDDDGTSTPTALSPDSAAGRLDRERKERRTLYPVRPPPILKKAGSSGSSRSTASSRSPIIGTPQIITENPEGDPGVPGASKSAIVDQQSPATSGGSPPTQRYVSTRFSEEVAVSIPQSISTTLGAERGERVPRSMTDASRGSGKRSHVVYSGSAASRKRPIVMRQKSGQASSAKSASPSSPLLGLQKKMEGDAGLTMAASSHTEQGGQQASPTASSVENDPEGGIVGEGERGGEEDQEDEEVEEEEVEQEEDEEAAESATGSNKEARNSSKEKTDENTKLNASSTQPASPLIDPTSRSRFPSQSQSQSQSRPQTHRSFTNLPSAAWRSTTTTPTATSYNASGMMLAEAQTPPSGRRGSGRAAFKDEIIPLKAPAPAGPDISDDTVEDAMTALPRTKSQLTLLLERNRAAGQDAKGKGTDRQ